MIDFSPIVAEVKEQSLLRIEENSRKIISCLAEFSEKELWHRPNENSLSLGNQLLHLCGNISQYILSSLGKQPDGRQRDMEFSATGGFNIEELTVRFSMIINQANETIRHCSDNEMMRKRKVQGFELTGIGIVLHVVEHLSYHTGQIIFWTKQLRNRPMGFYDHVNLNVKNENN